MKAPNFWHQKNYLSQLLLPISKIYQLAHRLKFASAKSLKVKKPIICIGNLIAGGAGKTPIAIEIGLMLKEMGIDFAYLSRGYGGKIDYFTQINSSHKSSDVGDEPLLLAEISSAFISKNRAFGADLISKMADKKMIILDDGLQNSSLFYDYKILVIDGKYGFGNEMTIPSGPLREEIKSGIEKVDLVIIIGEDVHNIKERFCQNKKVILAKIIAVDAEKFKYDKVIAFCGIGRPEKFFDSLRVNNIDVIKTFACPDHYLYKNSDLEKIISLAKDKNAKLATTKKDWVRIDKKYQDQIQYLDIRIEFDNPELIKNELLKLQG